MKISNWGRNPSIKNARLICDLENKIDQKVCLRGNGRSYGDASLYPTMLSTLNNKRYLVIENGVLKASAGFSLFEIFNFCQSKGYLFPVIPGTGQVTIGGMVASDVHGKNHKINGTIGGWIKSFELVQSKKERITCSLNENSDLFNATIGGMGLTGMIDSVEIILEKQKGYHLKQIVTKIESLKDVLEGLEKSNADYQTAWCDVLNESKYILFENSWNSLSQGEPKPLQKSKLSIPNIPFSILSKPLMKWYNRLYFKKHRSSEVVDLNKVFFPLDAIGNWNRLYGPKGFYQYQFVLPKSLALSGMELLFSKIKASKFPVYLAVIKFHGNIPSPGMLSFPMEGYSVALDFPNRTGVVSFLNELDEIVVEQGGRIYLAKDAVLKAKNFEKMYRNQMKFKTVLTMCSNSKFSSLLAERLNLTR